MCMLFWAVCLSVSQVFYLKSLSVTRHVILQMGGNELMWRKRPWPTSGTTSAFVCMSYGYPGKMVMIISAPVWIRIRHVPDRSLER
jgi:hypothetical protein